MMKSFQSRIITREEVCKENLGHLFKAHNIARYSQQTFYEFVGKGDLSQAVPKLLLNSRSFYRLFICITDNVVLSAQDVFSYFNRVNHWNLCLVSIQSKLFFKLLILITFSTELSEKCI